MLSSSSNQIVDSTQKPTLRNSFKLLKSHACKVANFTLQWQELEEHLRFIHSQIESKLQHNPATETIRTESQNDSNPGTKHLILSQNEDPEREAEDKDETGKRTSKVPVKIGKELIFYIKEHVSNRELLEDYLFKLFKAVDEPGKLVLDALEEFYPDGFRNGGYVDTGIRRSCVVLLEEFGKVRERVDDVAGLREEAKRMAVEWRGKMKHDNHFEVLGFLLLLIAFGLVVEFAFDEILSLFDFVSTMRQAPELFRALGFADKASDYIQRLITRNRRLDAVKFVYAFELVNQFPPVPLLKDHAKYAKKVSQNIRSKGNNSLEAQDNASKKEIAVLRKIIRFINNYQLGSEFSTEILRYKIQQRKKQRKERKANTKITGSNAQLQQNNRNKRTAPSPKAQQNRRKRNKRIQTAEPKASLNTSPSIYSKQPPHHQLACSFAGQGAEYSTPSGGTDAQSQSVPYSYVGATSNSQLQLSPTQEARILTGAQHLIPYFGNYHGAGSTSVMVNSYASLAAQPYELSGSATIRPHTSSSPRLYERGSIATNHCSGQIGYATTHTRMTNASNASTNTSFPYYRGELPRTSMYYNRQVFSSSAGIAPNTTFSNTSGCYESPVSSGGNYGVSPNYRPLIYHP